MSNTPIPVPSKAAIRALRGLVFGTSCSLALITEDRRRRINNARSAVRNAEKLKSARRYHSGGAEFAIALEEEALIDADAIHWQARDGAIVSPVHLRAWSTSRSSAILRKQESGNKAAVQQNNTPMRSPEARMQTETQDATRSTTITIPRKVPEPLFRPLNKLESSVRNTITDSQKILSQQIRHRRRLEPDLEQLLRQITQLLEAGDSKDTIAAAGLIQRCLEMCSDLGPHGQAIAEQAAIATRHCQELERIDHAQLILRLCAERGILNDTNYDLFNPYPVVKSLVPSEALYHPSPRDFAQQLDTACSVFLPAFSKEDRVRTDEVLKVGRMLLERSFLASKRWRLKLISHRLAAFSVNQSDLWQWLFERLERDGEYKLIVRSYLLQRSALPMASESFRSICASVVSSVTKAHGFKAEEVLERLFHDRTGDVKLRSPWVIDLLYGHWKKGRDFQGTQRLYDNYVRGAENSVYHPQAVFRVMIQIALEAGEVEKAEAWFAEAKSLDPSASSDIRVLGLFALARAKLGDWDGVRSTFDAMKTRDGTMSHDSGQEFVPIFKEYLTTHSIGETEDFLKSCIRDFQVPLSGSLVTLLAKEYGQLRDLESFSSWLQYCAHEGLPIDAAFSNAILHTARKYWMFDNRALQNLFRKLRSLNPGAEDEVTQRIMAHAACSHVSRSHRRPAKLGLVAAGRVGRSTEEREVQLAMKQSLVLRQAGDATKIYRRAVRSGMPHSGRCLALAVDASLKEHNGDVKAALALLKSAHARGEDVEAATAQLLVAQIKSVQLPSRNHDQAQAELNSVIAQIQEQAFPLSDRVLNQAALRMFKARHYLGAVTFGLSAADKRGEEPGYSPHNFIVLIEAYAMLSDGRGIRSAVDGLSRARHLHDTRCRQALKKAKKCLAKMAVDQRVTLAQTEVARGLSKIEEAMEELQADQVAFNRDAISIMTQAALDARNTSNYFDSAPWKSSSDRDSGICLDSADSESSTEVAPWDRDVEGQKRWSTRRVDRRLAHAGSAEEEVGQSPSAAAATASSG